MKNPAFLFYPGDWFKDPALRSVSHAAKGVWMDMLCLMFECEERGVLATNGKPWTVQDIAAAVGGDPRLTKNLVQELISKGVARRRDDGAIYCKRMVQDEAIRAGARNRKQKERSESRFGHGDVTRGNDDSVTHDVTPMSQRSSVTGTVTVQREGGHSRDKDCDGEGPPPDSTSPPDHPEASIPSVEEVIRQGAVQLIPDGYCRHYHEQCTIKHRWLSRGRLILWQRELIAWWRRDEYTWIKRAPQRPSWAVEEELKQTPELEGARRATLLAELETARQRERSNAR